jgi:hypothetical protein
MLLNNDPAAGVRMRKTMTSPVRSWCFTVACLVFTWRHVSTGAQETDFDVRDAEIGIRVGEIEVATFVHTHPEIPRPHFSALRTSGGTLVTRNVPPRADADKTDHAGIHSGLWLSFGDLNGNDPWRLKSRVRFDGLLEPPQVDEHDARFVIAHRYEAADGKPLCREVSRFCVERLDDGVLIRWTAEYHPDPGELTFGDQEEMGLGLRVATPLTVEAGQGGRILDASGRRNGDAVWGTSADWCDYAGPLDGRWSGVTLMTSPDNFRPSWHHARDYGLLVLNPFGRHALTGGPVSQVSVKHRESLVLKFGIFIHETATEPDCDLTAAFRRFAAP